MKKLIKQLYLLINYTRKSLQDNVTDECEDKSLCIISTIYFDETKNKSSFWIRALKQYSF